MNTADPSGYNWVSDRWHGTKDGVKTAVVVVAIAVLSFYTAGAASGWTASYYASCSIFGTQIVGGVVGGAAAAGFVSGAAYAALGGAKSADIIRGTLPGGATGAVFDGIGGYFPGTGKGSWLMW